MTTGPGLSRAAKKRAKKKRKQEDIFAKPTKQEEDPPAPEEFYGDEDSVDEDTQDEEAITEAVTEGSVPIDVPCVYSSLTEALDDDPELTARQRAASALAFLIAPTSVSDFYAKHWERQPLLATANDRLRLDGFLSLESIRSLSKNHTLQYGRDLNVTRYEADADGILRRRTLDLPGNVDVDPDILWDHYRQGCTIRLLCPHKQNDRVHALLSLLELEWGCMVGANAYLTPPNGAQGFAPHYDDIEAFVLQLEGRKRWKVYEPLNKQETLPRVSSSDYTDKDLRGVKPVLDVVLEPGDLLYMPRGWIHQACTLPPGQSNDEHSLHLTVSAMQHWAWVDLLDILLPEALESLASSESNILREGLPRDFLDYMGAMHDVSDEPAMLKQAGGLKVERDADEERRERIKERQEAFKADTKRRVLKVAKHACDMIDAACDQIGKRFLSERLPPALTESEKAETAAADEEHRKIQPNTLLQLVRPGIARMVLEDGQAVLYHCADNSRVYQEVPLSPMEFEMDDAPAIEQILTTTAPHWILAADLIHDTIDDKIGVAQALYDEGIVAIREMQV